MTCTMGCVVRRMNGRTRARCNVDIRLAFCVSASVWYPSSPVFWRRVRARRLSNVGAYVSGRKASPISWITAPAMLVAQKTHRQVVVSAMKPPAMGPTTGPRRGARL